MDQNEFLFNATARLQVIKAYKTSDGMLFETWDAAKNHEIATSFKFWYEKHAMLSGDLPGSYVRYSDLIEWLEQNRIEILTFLYKENESNLLYKENESNLRV